MKSLLPLLAAPLMLVACTRSEEAGVNATLHVVQPIGIAYLVVHSGGEPNCPASAKAKPAEAARSALETETIILDDVDNLDSLKTGTRTGRTLIGHANTLLQADVTVSEHTALRVRGSYRLFAEGSAGTRDTVYAPRDFNALKCPDYHPAAVE